MIAAVVPVRNEGQRLKKTFETLLSTPVDLIIPVINGSTDDSLLIAQQIQPRSLPVYFHDPLGIDVPRAIGAKIAWDRGARAVLFIDGDMDGAISKNLCELLDHVTYGHFDMSLTNCYPEKVPEGLSTLALHLLKERRRLNKKIGLVQEIAVASPCHGPHAVSRRFLNVIPLKEIAIPPVSLALAAKNGLKVNIGANICHKDLGSPEKDPRHSHLIAETIIGDCIEALHVYRGEKRSRRRGQIEHNGYHLERRWDLLNDFIRK
ncbi:MAG: Glycosyl transferase family 2 [Pelotomaculum sp. PtaB.Bin104]|nr:MAG: Glycosyl transferase family 2 [Pelotomaculum sp. PtaB.Bin104]